MGKKNCLESVCFHGLSGNSTGQYYRDRHLLNRFDKNIFMVLIREHSRNQSQCKRRQLLVVHLISMHGSHSKHARGSMSTLSNLDKTTRCAKFRHRLSSTKRRTDRYTTRKQTYLNAMSEPDLFSKASPLEEIEFGQIHRSIKLDSSKTKKLPQNIAKHCLVSG